MNTNETYVEQRTAIKSLSNSELVSASERLAAEERRISLALINHLEEIESRLLFLELGYASVWEFCVKHLKMSEGATGRRIAEQTLRAIRPEALPQERERILTSQETELRMVITEEFRSKILRLKEILAHTLPQASHTDILEFAVDQLLKKHELKTSSVEPKKEAPSPSPAEQAENIRSTIQRRHIPISLRREVNRRAGSRCEFVTQSGLRCTSRYALQIDHRIPVAKGGQNDSSNLRILCAKHNQFEAIRVFGKTKMNRYLTGRERNREIF